MFGTRSTIFLIFLLTVFALSACGSRRSSPLLFSLPSTPTPFTDFDDDDNNDNQDSEEVTLTTHRVFLVNNLSANMGGLVGADTICQASATGAGLGGNWKAILSDSSVSARDRLTINGPVVDMHDNVLAEDEEDFWDGELNSVIQYDRLGTLSSQTRIVWSGTNADGSQDLGSNTNFCSNWTSNSASSGIEAGRTDASDYRWLGIYGDNPQSNHACSNLSSLYCLEQ